MHSSITVADPQSIVVSWRSLPTKSTKTVLALLCLTLHEESRACKSFDWDTMNRLYKKGFISNPVGKAKSVLLTEKGLEESERLLKKLFVKPQP